MREWNGYCQRCYEQSNSYIMSMLNTQLICDECKDKETKRPDYKAAEARDIREYAGRLDGLGMRPQADNCRKLAAQLEDE